MGKFFIAVVLSLFISSAANAQCFNSGFNSGFSRFNSGFRVQPNFGFNRGFGGASNRQLLLLQAERLGLASRFEARFQNGLSLNDELELRRRLSGGLRQRNTIQFNRGNFSFGFGF